MICSVCVNQLYFPLCFGDKTMHSLGPVTLVHRHFCESLIGRHAGSLLSLMAVTTFFPPSFMSALTNSAVSEYITLLKLVLDFLQNEN